MINRDRHAALRGLELRVLRRLDGILQGDHRGLLPGHGFDSGEARSYRPGDDIRRIDWNVTARMVEPHVRDTIADRELDTTLVADVTASMSFGTALEEKRDTALAIVAAIGFLVTRGGNRVAGLVAAGDQSEWVPPGSGRAHLLALLSRVQAADRASGVGELAVALRTADRLTKRRGFVAVVSDFLDPGPWGKPLRALTGRHDVLAVEVMDPRELELPDVGLITMLDPETGRRRFVDTRSRHLRANYAAAAADQRAGTRNTIRVAHARHLVLRTDRDWMPDLIRHIRLQRSGQTTGFRR